jgi:hypothetical protein
MDIRLVRGRESRVWLTIGALAGGGVLLLVLVSVLGGDATMRAKRQVGAAANFGADRAPVLPMQTQAFETLLPLDNRELGRLVNLRATAESATRGHAVWVRTSNGRRILVRFEPEPPANALRGLGPGSMLDVNGYVQKISRAELDMWMDSLNVVIPRPRPGTKFGDVPDSGFAKIDSLFIKNYYVSVRPEGLRHSRSTASLRPDTTLTPYRDTTAAGRFRADSAARARAAADSVSTPTAPRTDTATGARTP